MSHTAKKRQAAEADIRRIFRSASFTSRRRFPCIGGHAGGAAACPPAGRSRAKAMRLRYRESEERKAEFAFQDERKVSRMAVLSIGWAETDITPLGPAWIMGQFHARLSEGVEDPLTATALALRTSEDFVVFVSCDLAVVSDELLELVRESLTGKEEGLDPRKVVLHATHTHAGAEVRPSSKHGGITSESGVELPAMPVSQYLNFAARRIAGAVLEAWRGEAAGGLSFGQGYAVVGRNRRWVNDAGESIMYRLDADSAEQFRHMEGYEDHSVNLAGTYDGEGRLTGLIVNVACPAQEDEQSYRFSADWWHETRMALRGRFGERLYILPQCSAAGDLTSHLLYDKAAHERMLRLKGRTAREEIAHRICTAAADALPFISVSSWRIMRSRRSTNCGGRIERLRQPGSKGAEADEA